MIQNSIGATKISKGPYRGWKEAFTLSNGKVEVVVVPEIGRIMQMRFAGEAEGPFWENRALDGKAPDANSSEWGNFGGDKAWPAPQAEWPKITGRGWPPPQGFDSMPVEARIEGEALVLKSPVDPHYGIQTERRIELAEAASEMSVATTYRKVSGKASRVSIWIITQLKDPVKLFMPVPKGSQFRAGYNEQSEKLPASLDVRDGILSCTRSRKDSTKIGSDGSRLIWAGEKEILELISPREENGEFPDNGSSAEIYTNPDPNAYIELELLGPLHTLTAGQSVSRKQQYRLHRRSADALETQIRDLRE